MTPHLMKVIHYKTKMQLKAQVTKLKIKLFQNMKNFFIVPIAITVTNQNNL